MQPGSTVITSMIEAEAKPKNCFILKVKEGNFIARSI